MLTTRQHYFQGKLAGLRGLVVPALTVAVDIYDTTVGGELDRMLAFEGLTKADLHADLIELARTPRLFKLVIRFRDRLVEADQVTVHRLLWEYGRDTFGDRAGKSFSEDEWRAWLAEIAKCCRNGIQKFSLRNLGETATRPDLSEREIYARLSDIIDGRFVTPGPLGAMQLSPTVVAHALGMALLAHLEDIGDATFAAIETDLAQWLDPIAGLDQRAEILRAAVSIFVERGVSTTTPVAGVLVTAWLQTQNVSDSHRRELASLAPSIPEALLDAVEQSAAYAQASARMWAINALRAIPRAEGPPLTAIIARVRVFVDARSNAATSSSISVQMAIIVSLHKIAKEAPVIFHRVVNIHCFLALTGISAKLISLRLRPTPFMIGLKCAPAFATLEPEGPPRPPALLPLAAFTNLRWNPCGYVCGPVA
jgi:hypothetical protein